MSELDEKILPEETPEEEKPVEPASPEQEQEAPAEAPAEGGEPEPEKEKKIVPGQGVDAEKYDVSEPWLDGRRVDDSARGLEIRYDLRGDEVRKALKYFQKKALYRKNTIFTVILAIIAALYAQSIFQDPSYTMGYLMIVLAVGVIWILWFLPSRHIKSAAQAADLSQDSFSLEICPGGLLLPQEDGRYLVGFDRPAVRAAEFSDLFLIVASREKLFVLPKRCIPEEDQQSLREMLKEALGARFELVQAKE